MPLMRLDPKTPPSRFAAVTLMFEISFALIRDPRKSARHAQRRIVL